MSKFHWVNIEEGGENECATKTNYVLRLINDLM